MMKNSNNYVVYKHTSPSGKSYVGLTKNYAQRCRAHKSKISKCPVFFNAIKKYGWDAFTHEILIGDLSLKLANIFEKHFIEVNNSLSPNGYNLRLGGDVMHFTDETRKKISDSKKNVSIETRLKLSIANTGKRCSEETKRKISKAQTMMPQSQRDAKSKKLSIVKTGIKLSTETRAKISISHKGRQHSLETRRKISKANTKPLIIDGVTYDSVTQASTFFNIACALVYYRVNSKSKRFSSWQYQTTTEVCE